MGEKSVEAYKEPVPYIVYESTIARFERTIKRLIIGIIIAIVLIAVSNMAWLYAWNQYDYQDIVVDGQNSGTANFMGNGASGVISNGTDQSANTN